MGNTGTASGLNRTDNAVICGNEQAALVSHLSNEEFGQTVERLLGSWLHWPWALPVGRDPEIVPPCWLAWYQPGRSAAVLSAHDVARELRQRLPDAGDVKIHKLVYYCQGWHLAWKHAPMFSERIEAWANGPVVADLWHNERQDRPRPPAQHLDDEQLAVLEYVVDRYGRHTGKELVRKTHLEDPWRDVSESDDNFATENAEITPDALYAWFSQDEELVIHRSEVARLMKRRDVYGFDGVAMPDDLRSATLRVLAERTPS